MRNHHLHPGVILLTFLLIMLLSISVSAYESTEPGSGVIGKIDLGVSDLTLNVGDTYTFDIRYVPEDKSYPWLNWFLTNDNIISIDPDTATVTALAAGNARILAESPDGIAYTFCDVAVNGKQPKAGSGMTAGTSVVTLSEADQAKITAPQLKRFVNFIGSTSSLSEGSADDASERMFALPAEVVPGTEKAQAKRALSLGMEKAEPLVHLHVVTLLGTFEQILAYAADNQDLIEIFDFMPVSIDDPVAEDELSGQKAVELQGNVEALTKISTAHLYGFTGKNATIAVIDTGLNAKQADFKGRVKYQACFSTGFKSGNTVYNSVCSSAKSAAPGKAKVKVLFNHGSHVAGIMAGKYGIAPDADIAAVQTFTEVCEGKASANTCTDIKQLSVDELSAYEYLFSLIDDGVRIAAVNMSYGGGSYSSACDDLQGIDKNGNYRNKHVYFDVMYNTGRALPVVSSGNDGCDGCITSPACDSCAFAVGALEDSPTPVIKNFSNHNELVDMLAPGTNIYSSLYAKVDKKLYGKMNGTSMAAPMVTGAIAILNQIYPYNSPAEYEKLLNMISEWNLDETKRTASYRNGGCLKRNIWGTCVESNDPKAFDFSTPVLNFSAIGAFVRPAVRESDVTVEGINNGFRVTVPYDPFTHHNLWVIDAETGDDVEGLALDEEIDPSGEYYIFTITGQNLINDHVYVVQEVPFVTYDNTKYYMEAVNVLSMPAKPIEVTVKPLGGGAQLTANNPSAETRTQFFIYDAASGQMVKKVAPAGNKTVGKVSGLKNGSLYYVAAQTYKAFTKKVTVTGAVSEPVYFVPMTTPGGVKITWKSNTTADITVSADKLATGFRVFYRPVDGDFVSACQETFGNACTINGLDKDGAYDFYIMKYVELAGRTHPFYGPGLVKTYKSSASGLTAPDSVEVIGSEAFKGNTTLTSVIIPASMPFGTRRSIRTPRISPIPSR